MTDPDLDHLRNVGSPLAIGASQSEWFFGPDIKFRADPWLQMAEKAIMRAVAYREDTSFLKINAPPQVSKSTLVEILTPIWALMMWPNTRIILVAYSDDLAIRSGAKVRDFFMELGPNLFGLTVDPRYESKQEWKLHGHQGSMLSVGIGSRISGMPGDLVIIGDVLKDMEEASSPRVKESHWTSYESAIRPRVQPGGTMLLTATRFAEDDLSGKIEAAQREDPDYPDQWESLVFKAIAEPDYRDRDAHDPNWRDILGRRRGVPLRSRYSKPGEEDDPERWHNSHFYRMKRGRLPFVFSCVYQQTPTVPEGGMFPPEKWRFFDPETRPRMTVMRRSWDLAASEGANDYSTGALVGKDADGNYYVLDLTRFRKSPDRVLDDVEMWGKLDGRGVPIQIEEERNGAGKTVISFYKKALLGFTVKASAADGTKEDRARPYSTLQQKGKVFLPHGPEWEWVPAFIDEHRMMMGDGRRGPHDDMIDVVAHAINDTLDSGSSHLLDPGVRMQNSTGGLIVVDDEELPMGLRV